MNKKKIIGLCEFLRIHHFENAYTLLDYFEEKDKEIKRLNHECDTYLKIATKRKNIIDELEKWLEEKQDLTCGCGITPEYIYAYENCLDKLKELKDK